MLNFSEDLSNYTTYFIEKYGFFKTKRNMLLSLFLHTSRDIHIHP